MFRFFILNFLMHSISSYFFRSFFLLLFGIFQIILNRNGKIYVEIEKNKRIKMIVVVVVVWNTPGKHQMIWMEKKIKQKKSKRNKIIKKIMKKKNRKNFASHLMENKNDNKRNHRCNICHGWTTCFSFIFTSYLLFRLDAE